IPQDDSQKMMVLDGQQRMQSLFIGLCGSYAKKELYVNILSGDLVAPEDIKFDFKFKKNTEAEFPFIKFKSLVMTDERVREIIKHLKSKHPQINDENTDRAQDNVELIREVFCTQENILYQLVDSIDRPSTYSEDDIVEIFIRANSGGTQLGKSDLLFSLLNASWEDAEDKMDELIKDLNLTGFNFDRDFILKVCLVLLNKGAKYEISKFRDPDVKNGIEKNWDEISNSIRFVKDFVYGNTYLKTDKTLPSYFSLVPLIYAHYHFEDSWLNQDEYSEYLVKVNLTGVFGGVSDGFTDSLVKNVKDTNKFDKTEIFALIRSKGKSMEITDTKFLEIHYTSKQIHLLFNLWYGFNYQPVLKENKPQIDHIFPQSVLKKIKVLNPENGKMNLMKYKWFDRDQIANLMLLTAKENGASGKLDTLPKDWFKDKSDEYLEKHLIPKDQDLWELDRFEDFIEARKELILGRFSDLIYLTNLNTEEDNAPQQNV
ncbi:HNH endonuclease family protein, partial [Schleiferiaceae bacterium]|nr:HNH endonuclease family protein [Schleiferiaceae bacterium]